MTDHDMKEISEHFARASKIVTACMPTTAELTQAFAQMQQAAQTANGSLRMFYDAFAGSVRLRALRTQLKLKGRPGWKQLTLRRARR